MFDESAERRAVLELGQALQDAWNRGDAAGYASLFTDDADFVAWNGSHRRAGRPSKTVVDGSSMDLRPAPGWPWSMTARHPHRPDRCGSSARMWRSWSSRVR